jgi:hypothetical protein
MAAAGTTPGAERFITGAISHAAESHAVELHAAELHAAELHAAELATVPALRPGLSTETGKRLADTLHLAVRAAHARVPSAATAMADRPRAFRHAERPASVVERRVAEVGLMAADLTAAATEAGAIDPRSARH